MIRPGDVVMYRMGIELSVPGAPVADESFPAIVIRQHESGALDLFVMHDVGRGPHRGDVFHRVEIGRGIGQWRHRD